MMLFGGDSVDITNAKNASQNVTDAKVQANDDTQLLYPPVDGVKVSMVDRTSPGKFVFFINPKLYHYK